MYRSCGWQKITLFIKQDDGKLPYSKWFHTQLPLAATFFIVTLCPHKLFIKSNILQLVRKSCYFIPQFLQHVSAHTEPSSRRTTLPELWRVQNQILLRRALQLFIRFGPLNNSIPLLSIDNHSHLSRILFLQNPLWYSPISTSIFQFSLLQFISTLLFFPPSFL